MRGKSRNSGRRNNSKFKNKQHFLEELSNSNFFENYTQGRNNTQNDQQHQNQQPQFKSVHLTPRGKNQQDYVDFLLDPNKHVVFGIGPAGSGKTLLATQVAIKLLQEKEIDKVVITRPAVSVDEQHGFLPGDLNTKLAPWVQPIIDVFEEHYSPRAVQNMIKNKQICVEPLAFMRGRTFKNSFIIGDEMQNSLPSQMKMLLTRIGDNSKMVITGDLRQHDRTYEANGLMDFIDRLEEKQDKETSMIRVCRFNNSDIQRHAVITEILGLYGEF